MKIFVLNRGSASIKSALYDFSDLPSSKILPLWEGALKWKGNFTEPFLTIKNKQGAVYSEAIKEKTAEEALPYLMKFLFQGETAVIGSLNDIEVVGHRIAHGGSYFKNSVYITDYVKEKITLLSSLAPLHNAYELQGITIMEQLLKGTPQVAVFDTAFHHTLPEAAKIYPGPYRWYEEGIQRYGFHGISFRYCAKKGASLLNQNLKDIKMVICHLGSGASLCAVKDGVSIDTTMGLTPLDGLMMNTRAGSVDPGILLHLLKKKTVEELSHELYEESGLLGISEVSGDMEDLIKIGLHNPRATLALDIYLHRLNALIGSMIASLSGIDVLIFTAGIGEHIPLIREKVCKTFSFLDVKLDKKKNETTTSEDRILSTDDSKVKVLLVHTQEDFEIACECYKLKNSLL